MKLLSENSTLNMLPREMKQEHLHIFDAIRIIIESIEYSYDMLNSQLLSVSQGNRINASATLIFAWSIIDNTHRLQKFCNKLPYENMKELMSKINFIYEFRNTYQHLNERFDKMWEVEKKPTFGAFTWAYCKNINDKEFMIYAFIPGNNKSNEFTWNTVKSEDLIEGISSIRLETFTLKEPNILEFDKLFNELKYIVKDLEISIVNFCNEYKLLPCDWSMRQDMILQTQVKKN